VVLRALLAVLLAAGGALAAPLEASLPEAPVPASWNDVRRLEKALARRQVTVVYSDRCPKGLEGMYDHRVSRLLMCRNTMPNRPEHHWNTLAHEAVHVMQICRQAAPLSSGQEQIQAQLLAAMAPREKLHILAAYPPEQRLYELEARWVANTVPPAAVLELLERSCGPVRPDTSQLLAPLLGAATGP
jgi:hypothetical protein